MNDRFFADDLPRRAASAARPIDLAHTRSFRIGDVEVRPASREVVGGDKREVLEPLVMQVLIALASARGEILSRDDLIDACWGGRAVTDDAINRVMSRLRALARTFEEFQVETVTKVGYRLVAQVGNAFPAIPALEAEQPAQRFAIGRRGLMTGGAAAAVLGAGAVVWRRPWKHRPPAEAVESYRRGEIAQRQGFAGQERQAIAFYERAVRIDPLYADAWGGLALANTHLLEGFGEAEFAAVPDRLRSAARRALELDPDNADARLALVLVKPFFRNWASMEAELRRLLDRYPRHWLLLGRLGGLLYDVGRLSEGIALHKKLSRIDPMLPVADAYRANAMLSAGRLQEAEALLDQAQVRWTGHPSLWMARFRYLLFSGRPEAARAFVIDPDSRPSGIGDEEVALLERLTRAVHGRRPADVEISLRDFERRAAADVATIPSSAVVFAILGRADLTFAAWERYFFNRGPFATPAPIEPYTRRYARDLFSRPMAPLRSDPRFASLLRRIGLEDYWRLSGTLPDYRRGSL